MLSQGHSRAWSSLACRSFASQCLCDSGQDTAPVKVKRQIAPDGAAPTSAVPCASEGASASLWRSAIQGLVAWGATWQQAADTQAEAALSLSTLLVGPLQGGLVFVVAGAVGSLVRRVAGVLFEAAQRQFVVRAQIDSRDDAFRWLMHWLAHRPGAARARHVAVATSLSEFGREDRGYANHEEGDGPQGDEQEITMLPAPGEHVAHYKGRRLWIQRDVGDANARGHRHTRPHETLRITLLGRSLQVVRALVEDARALYVAAQRNQTAVYTVGNGAYWMAAGCVPARSLDSVVLPDDAAHALLADCTDFLASRAWYARRGVPYRRGYLLHGPPGCGKTSVVRAVAGALRLPIYVVTLASPSMTDEDLRELLVTARARGVVLLEDVDAAFAGRKRGRRGGGLTFSGLLNAIDGVAAQEGRLVFMTTNHVERLDAALVRPGRVDVRVAFALCTPPQVCALFERFYTDLPAAGDAPLAGGSSKKGDVDGEAWTGTHKELSALARNFAARVPAGVASAAALQGFLMQHKNRPDQARAAVDAFVSGCEAAAAEKAAASGASADAGSAGDDGEQDGSGSDAQSGSSQADGSDDSGSEADGTDA